MPERSSTLEMISWERAWKRDFDFGCPSEGEHFPLFPSRQLVRPIFKGPPRTITTQGFLQRFWGRKQTGLLFLQSRPVEIAKCANIGIPASERSINFLLFKCPMSRFSARGSTKLKFHASRSGAAVCALDPCISLSLGLLTSPTCASLCRFMMRPS